MPTSPMTRTAELADFPHQRLNLLTGRWILVSPQRTQRPWLGKVEERPIEATLAYDPSCYLCPGNARAGDACNPQYLSTFVFDNDYPALLQDTPHREIDESGLIVARSEQGLCRVICLSSRHDLTIPRLSPAELRQIVDVWVEQYQALGSMSFVNHVLVFENRGVIMGASNPHPHCQVWANATVPCETQTEQNSLLQYRARVGSCLLCDYLRLELQLGERIVCENEGFVVVVPYWAVWPFETLLLSRCHFGAMDQLSSQERDLLGDILKRLTTRYDNLFETVSPTPWAFIRCLPMDNRIRSGTSTPTTTRRCCARQQCRSSWLGTRCWQRRSETLRQKTLRTVCEVLARSIICSRAVREDLAGMCLRVALYHGIYSRGYRKKGRGVVVLES